MRWCNSLSITHCCYHLVKKMWKSVDRFRFVSFRFVFFLPLNYRNRWRSDKLQTESPRMFQHTKFLTRKQKKICKIFKANKTRNVVLFVRDSIVHTSSQTRIISPSLFQWINHSTKCDTWEKREWEHKLKASMFYYCIFKTALMSVKLVNTRVWAYTHARTLDALCL